MSTQFSVFILSIYFKNILSPSKAKELLEVEEKCSAGKEKVEIILHEKFNFILRMQIQFI